MINEQNESLRQPSPLKDMLTVATDGSSPPRDVEERFAEGIEYYRKVILPVMMEEAKREEREGIIDKVENLIIGGRLGKPEQEGEDVYFLEAKGWQALRGEK